MADPKPIDPLLKLALEFAPLVSFRFSSSVEGAGVMKLQVIEEPRLAFHENNMHVDIRAGLSAFGAFDKGSVGVPIPIRLGVIGTTATVDGVRDWLEQCKNGVASDEQKLTTLRPAFPGMTQQVFGTSLELSDTATRTITRHELTAALGDRKSTRLNSSHSGESRMPSSA